MWPKYVVHEVMMSLDELWRWRRAGTVAVTDLKEKLVEALDVLDGGLHWCGRLCDFTVEWGCKSCSFL